MSDLDYFWLALIAVAAIAFIWLAVRAFRARRRLVKWIGGVATLLLAAAMCAICVMVGLGMVRTQSRHAPVPQITVAGTPGQIARGKEIADGFCSACHTRTLIGGVDMARSLPVPIGSLVTANLTPTGLKDWSDGEIFRAIRNGVGADGHWLMGMSLARGGHISDDDTEAVIAYLRSLSAAGAPTPSPPDRFNMLGLTMLGAGLLPTGERINTGKITAPPKGPTVEFGEYILSYQDCRGCHGQNLGGGVPGQIGPIGPDLHLVKDWTLRGFIATMRTGVDPNGHYLSKAMPWRPVGRMRDEELAAMYQYLIRLPGA